MADRKVPVAALKSAFDVLDLVPSKSTVRSSDFIQVSFAGDRVYLRLTSDIRGIAIAPARGSWTPGKPIYIDRKLLSAFVKSVDSGEKDEEEVSPFIWSERQGKLVVSWQSREMELDQSLEVQGYGKFRDVKTLKKLVLDKKFQWALAAAGNCATNDPSVPHLNCVYLHEGKVFATDNRVLFSAEHEGLKSTHIPFPVSIVTTLASPLVEVVYHGDSCISVKCKNGFLEQAVQSKPKEEFPFAVAEKRLELAKKYEKLFVCNSAEFGAVTNRLSSYLSSVKREDWNLRLSLTKGSKEIQVTCSIAQGKFQDVLACSPAQNTLVLEWPLDKLLPVFSYFEKLNSQMSVSVEQPNKKMNLIGIGDVRLLIAAKVKR